MSARILTPIINSMHDGSDCSLGTLVDQGLRRVQASVGLAFLGLWLFSKTRHEESIAKWRGCRSRRICNPKQERMFVPPELTPERLLSFFEENTTIQATELTKDRIGQWIQVTGTVRNVGAFNGYFVSVSFEKTDEPQTWFDYAEILCYFMGKLQINRLKILKRGDKIIVIGQISRIRTRALELDNCELVNS